ncbi:hypothetical protein MLD52_05170 [Puniceicoccaceae bacterium K14]|nr:hypothetical protein [Puniceicoccaceae bacterium K14]
MKKIHELSIRVNESNPNHHLWNNNGVWWLHFTVYPTPVTTQRIRKSLKTKSLEAARIRRDHFLEQLNTGAEIPEVVALESA